MISYFIKKDGSLPDKWLHLPDSQTNGFIRLIPRLSPPGGWPGNETSWDTATGVN